ncbi:MAG: histidine--tRNA ligase [Chloroflexi bacterium]|nr:histidine--tRNA ligase [Chloroflexota bacterium]
MANPVQTLQGMRDWLPGRSRLRAWIISRIRENFERSGFEPVETPALEYAETLKGKYGEEADKLIYAFTDRGGREVGLRYDLTVPLARVVASHPDLSRPFKRYHIAPVWRAERPQRGRYREFTQCDIDVVGVPGELADADVLFTVMACLVDLGLPGFVVRLNDRRLLQAIVARLGIAPNRALGLFRALDKLDKIGTAGVRAELMERGFSGAEIDGLFGFLIPRGDPSIILPELGRTLGGREDAAAAIASLGRLVSALAGLGIASDRLQVDPTLVRGLDYYTGCIYEVTVVEPAIGSLVGGGRYDDLIGIFTGRPTPATGGALGLDRIIDVIEALGLAPAGMQGPVAPVQMTIFSEETLATSLRVAGNLRRAGIACDLAIAGGRLSNQLRDAARRGVRWSVIAGPDEIEQGKLLVRDMVSGEQTALSEADAGEFLRGQL